MIVRDGQHEAASRIAASAYGVELPATPRASTGGTCDFAWSGPNSWLAVGTGKDLVSDLEQRFAGCAAVADQSHARAVLRVGSRRIRETLAKGCPVDLHPRAFEMGTIATTSISHIGVTIWQIDDQPAYDLLIFRSLAKSFWAWISTSAAQYGLDVRLPPPSAQP